MLVVILDLLLVNGKELDDFIKISILEYTTFAIEIAIYQKRNYNAIISAYYVINYTLSHDLNCFESCRLEQTNCVFKVLISI